MHNPTTLRIIGHTAVLSRATMRNIRQNLAFALGIPVAAGAELGVRAHQRVAAQSRQVVNLAQQQPIRKHFVRWRTDGNNLCTYTDITQLVMRTPPLSTVASGVTGEWHCNLQPLRQPVTGRIKLRI